MCFRDCSVRMLLAAWEQGEFINVIQAVQKRMLLAGREGTECV